MPETVFQKGGSLRSRDKSQMKYLKLLDVIFAVFKGNLWYHVFNLVQVLRKLKFIYKKNRHCVVSFFLHYNTGGARSKRTLTNKQKSNFSGCQQFVVRQHQAVMWDSILSANASHWQIDTQQMHIATKSVRVDKYWILRGETTVCSHYCNHDPLNLMTFL